MKQNIIIKWIEKLLWKKEYDVAEIIKEKAKEQKKCKCPISDYDFITKHATKRLEQRFKYRGIKEEDIKKDLANPLKRKNRKGIYTIYGKHWQYIISEQKVLITVI